MTQEPLVPSPAATTDEPDSVYRRDIRRICHVMEESGANQRSLAEHQFVVADWLGRNISAPKSRAFLAELARTAPANKAALLMTTAASVGLDDCPLAQLWDAPPASPTANPVD